MDQISVNTIPAMQTGVSKKAVSVSWLSDIVVGEKKSFDGKDAGFSKDFKKRK